ncbi:MAG: PDZ domain-containing protein [Ardenticatenaceae bacterium]
MAPFLEGGALWVMALLLTLALVFSVLWHTLAHVWAARARHSDLPSQLPLYPFGEPAQVWPAARAARFEALHAIAGPLGSLLLAGLTYLLWDQQWNRYADVVLLFLALANFLLALVNLTPAMPLDGGRLVRATVWGLLGQRGQGTRLATRLGFLVVTMLVTWGAYLLLQRARFSLATGGATLLVGIFLYWVLRRHWALEDDSTQNSWRPASLLRTSAATLTVILLFAIPLSFLPTLHGLEAPGFAIPIEPMIVVAEEHYHPSEGSFLLTTVIQQTPILLGQWVAARLDPTVEIVPPESVIPPGTTPQEIMEANFRLLEESRQVAAAVGLRLAGYPVQVEGHGVRIVSVLPESPAQRHLLPGDQILALNGVLVRTVSELRAEIARLHPQARVLVRVAREGQEIVATTSLMPPAEGEETPRLGVVVESVGLDVQLPFPVRIEPQKIAGGPSAGLMFALTVYDLVTPGELTGGRRIAGTGTIDPDGNVGAIGGVAQKVASAEQAGAELFLVPPANYADARRAATRIQVIEVASAREAIRLLEGMKP